MTRFPFRSLCECTRLDCEIRVSFRKHTCTLFARSFKRRSPFCLRISFTLYCASWLQVKARGRAARVVAMDPAAVSFPFFLFYQAALVSLLLFRILFTNFALSALSRPIEFAVRLPTCWLAVSDVSQCETGYADERRPSVGGSISSFFPRFGDRQHSSLSRACFPVEVIACRPRCSKSRTQHGQNEEKKPLLIREKLHGQQVSGLQASFDARLVSISKTTTWMQRKSSFEVEDGLSLEIQCIL